MEDSGKIEDIHKINNISELIKRAKWLEGKTLSQVYSEIGGSDYTSRVLTKGHVGTAIEKGFFNIEKNSDANPDIVHLGVEVKTTPLKYNNSRTRISVKEPLSLNIINYTKEAENESIKESALYKKNKKIIFIVYLHDHKKERSEYKILKVFLWEIDDKVIEDLEPDYKLIINKIRQGKAHEIHQKEHKFLTICPKHNGKFKDPTCKHSKTKQPFSDVPAEIRAFRLKTVYMNKILAKEFHKDLFKGGWDAD